MLKKDKRLFLFVCIATSVLLSLVLTEVRLQISKVYVENRVDEKIIREYQKPIVGKLDTLINLYSNGRRIEIRDTATVYR